MVYFTCPTDNASGICAMLDETGAGLGNLFYYLGQSLPTFLLILAIIGAVVSIIMAVVFVIKTVVVRRI